MVAGILRKVHRVHQAQTVWMDQMVSKVRLDTMVQTSPNQFTRKRVNGASNANHLQKDHLARKDHQDPAATQVFLEQLVCLVPQAHKERRDQMDDQGLSELLEKKVSQVLPVLPKRSRDLRAHQDQLGHEDLQARQDQMDRWEIWDRKDHAELPELQVWMVMLVPMVPWESRALPEKLEIHKTVVAALHLVLTLAI